MSAAQLNEREYKMDTKDIPAKLIALHTAMNDKMETQCLEPDCFIYPESNKPFLIKVWGENVRSGTFTAKAISLEECFDLADAHIAGLPSVESIRTAEFQRDLGRLIEKGREYSIPLDFVNPLIATSKALAENAIEDKREA